MLLTPNGLILFFWAPGVLLFFVFFTGPHAADKPGGGPGAPVAIERGPGTTGSGSDTERRP